MTLNRIRECRRVAIFWAMIEIEGIKDKKHERIRDRERRRKRAGDE